MKLTTIFLTLACLAGTLASAAESKPAKPNLILILVDDMGYGDIGPFGSQKNRTPNLDRMASEGMKLTSFYGAPLCTASRSQLMTGCYARRISMPAVLFPAQPIGLGHQEKTIAELLKPQGYATMCIGKWHLGDQPEFLPTRRGFDHYVGLPYSNDMGRKKIPLPLMRDTKVVEAPAVQENLEALYTGEAVKFITANKNRPFFLYLPHTAVHLPYHPGQQFSGKSGNGKYGDWVEEVDWSTGRILDALRELKLDKTTLVIFTSDNGGIRSESASNGPLRGFKGTTWEGGVRVPTIGWWPGKITAGSSSDAILSEIDFLPTLVSLAGGTVPTDRKIDGLDIWPVISGQSKISPHDALFYFDRGSNPAEGVRAGPWKLLKGELYNLDEDIGETKNVADKNPEVVQRLQILINKLNSELENGGFRPHANVDKPQPLLRDGREYD